MHFIYIRERRNREVATLFFFQFMPYSTSFSA